MLGRLIFLLTWPLLLHIIPIWHQHTPSDYYFAFPAGIIFHAVLIQLMFSIRHERITFWILMVANFVMLLTSIDLLLFFETELSSSVSAMVSSKYYLLDAVLYWLLFFIVTYFLVRSIDDLFEKVSSDQKIIEDQKEELTVVNEELQHSNETLQTLNSKMSSWNESLEETVAKRTHEIEEQNEKLRAYAFYNAHKLRAPYCRIKGLLMLQEIVRDPEERQYIDSLLEKSLHELDLVIEEIQQIVNERSVK
jgi:hypothetical protein